MIKAQRNYQANAQSISTDEKMTQTILNIRN
jgi:flagellar hook protein FlgE